MIKDLLREFMQLVASGQVEVYNEFSFQHELGIFLRNRLTEYKVEFERNTKFFGIDGLKKHEIDIVVYNKISKFAIELKYPQNGQYPEQMFSFVKDIAFMEQLKNNGFKNCYLLTMVNDKNFYSGKKTDGIYNYFRNGAVLNGEICKPTGNIMESVILKGCYNIIWENKSDNMKYYIVDVGENFYV